MINFCMNGTNRLVKADYVHLVCSDNLSHSGKEHFSSPVSFMYFSLFFACTQENKYDPSSFTIKFKSDLKTYSLPVKSCRTVRGSQSKKLVME